MSRDLWPEGLCQNYSTLPLGQATEQTTGTEAGCVPTNLHLQKQAAVLLLPSHQWVFY